MTIHTGKSKHAAAKEAVLRCIADAPEQIAERKMITAYLAQMGLSEPHHLNNAIRALGLTAEDGYVWDNRDIIPPDFTYVPGVRGPRKGAAREKALDWVRERLPCNAATLFNEGRAEGHTDLNMLLALIKLDPMIENKSSTVIDW